MFMETLTQRQSIQNGVAPQTLNNAYAATAGVDMSKSHRVQFILFVGAVTSGSISAWLQESSDNFSTDIPTNGQASAFSNSSGSGLSLTGLTSSNKIYSFEVRSDQLTSGKRYARLQIKEVNGSATYVTVSAIGDEANQKPNSLADGSYVITQNVVA